MTIRALRTEWIHKATDIPGVSQQHEYRHGIASVEAECDCGHEWTARRGLPAANGGIVRAIGFATLICPACRAQQQFALNQLEA